MEYDGVRKELAGGEIATTNNRMELQAAIQALLALKEPCEVELYTDSEYLREGITQWIQAWKARGWKKKVKNKDLWSQEGIRASATYLLGGAQARTEADARKEIEGQIADIILSRTVEGW